MWFKRNSPSAGSPPQNNHNTWSMTNRWGMQSLLHQNMRRLKKKWTTFKTYWRVIWQERSLLVSVGERPETPQPSPSPPAPQQNISQPCPALNMKYSIIFSFCTRWCRSGAPVRKSVCCLPRRSLVSSTLAHGSDGARLLPTLPVLLTFLLLLVLLPFHLQPVCSLLPASNYYLRFPRVCSRLSPGER